MLVKYWTVHGPNTSHWHCGEVHQNNICQGSDKSPDMVRYGTVHAPDTGDCLNSWQQNNAQHFCDWIKAASKYQLR